jgi:hypothetical protein
MLRHVPGSPLRSFVIVVLSIISTFQRGNQTNSSLHKTLISQVDGGVEHGLRGFHETFHLDIVGLKGMVHRGWVAAAESRLPPAQAIAQEFSVATSD